MKMILICVICTIIGVITGVTMHKKLSVTNSKPSGTIRVDISDPDGPFLFLELNDDLATVCAKTKIVCTIDTKSYISQK